MCLLMVRAAFPRPGPHAMQEYLLLGSFNGDSMGMQTQDGEITALLAGWRQGDGAAMERLYPLIRAELHRLARRHLGREGRHHTVQPSTLVQEAVLRLLPAANCGWRDRAHFYAVASHVMRHVLVDYARGCVRNAAAARITFQSMWPWS